MEPQKGKLVIPSHKRKKKKGSEPFDGKQSTGRKSIVMYLMFQSEKKIQSFPDSTREGFPK